MVELHSVMIFCTSKCKLMNKDTSAKHSGQFIRTDTCINNRCGVKSSVPKV